MPSTIDAALSITAIPGNRHHAPYAIIAFKISGVKFLRINKFGVIIINEFKDHFSLMLYKLPFNKLPNFIFSPLASVLESNLDPHPAYDSPTALLNHFLTS